MYFVLEVGKIVSLKTYKIKHCLLYIHIVVKYGRGETSSSGSFVNIKHVAGVLSRSRGTIYNPAIVRYTDYFNKFIINHFNVDSKSIYAAYLYMLLVELL